MAKERTNPDAANPHLAGVTQAVAVVGGKWKLLLLVSLLGGSQRFSQLQRQLPGITQRMLTLQLRELEADGLVARTVYKQVPPRVEYALTPLGQSLAPALSELEWWGAAYTRRQAQRGHWAVQLGAW